MILNVIKKNKPDKISFIFDEGEFKGKQFSGELKICHNLSCNCGTIYFNLINEQSKNNGEQKTHEFSIDVFQKNIDKDKVDDNSNFDIKFAKDFVKELKKEDWDFFHKLYTDYKIFCTKTTDIEKMETEFPMDEIEEDALNVGFYEILPFSENIIFEIDNKKFLIDDQYCVSSSCDCTGTFINFIPITEADSLEEFYTTIYLDYKNNSWKVEELSKDIEITPKKLMAELFSQKNWASIFSKRHNQLRILYKN
ncbi:hypothetical protein HY745_08535 [Candidatus Desantisbacteria bacterium]|nr:hypothetical protein [Candidatus Desantisbacteria bacterium]